MPRRRRRREREERQRRLRTSSQSSVEIHVSEANHGVSITTSSAAPSRSASYGAVPAGSQPLLFRPSPDFSGLLKGIKAQGCLTHQGELFTLKQLCYYLKEYIKMKQLYDPLDPRKVYCEHDPLGKVFSVKSFTVNDAVNLVMMNTQPVDLCYPRPEQSPPTYFSAQNCIRPEQPAHFSSIPPSFEHLNSPVIDHLLKTPPKCEQAKSLPEIERSATKRTLHFEESPQASTSQGSDEKPDDRWHKRQDCKRKRDHSKNSECLSPPAPCRRRESSFSLTCTENAFCLELAASESEAESVYSVQSKETMLVKSSSDDYWFLDEEEEEEEDDSISFQFGGQGSVSLEFRSDNNAYMEEYEIEAMSSDAANEDDDVGSSSPEEEIRVTIQSEDFGFWADSESSDQEDDDTDHEISEVDKWKCSKCEVLNRPYMRNCEKCWSLRPGWLKSDPLCPQNVACPSPRKADPRRPVLAKSSSSADSGIASSLESRLPDVSSTTPESPKPSTSVNRSKLHLTNTWSDLPFSPISPSLRSPAPRFFAHSPRKRTSSLGDSCDVCVICMQKPKEASIIHGKTGHQICCYVCAKRLRRRGKPCPVCRRPIQKVIKNFIL